MHVNHQQVQSIEQRDFSGEETTTQDVNHQQMQSIEQRDLSDEETTAQDVNHRQMQTIEQQNLSHETTTGNPQYNYATNATTTTQNTTLTVYTRSKKTHYMCGQRLPQWFQSDNVLQVRKHVPAVEHT